MNDRKLLEQALEALELHAKQYPHMQKGYTVDAITALRERLVQPDPLQRLTDVQQEIEAALAPERELPWLRAIDEAMIVHHIGVADPADDYETAKRKVNNLLCHAQDIGAYFAKQAEPDQEPVVVIKRNESGQITMQTPDGNPFDMSKYIGAKLYATPQKREWQGLTDEEIYECEKVGAIHYQRHKCSVSGQQLTPADDPQWHFAGAIEAKLKEKND